MSRIMSVFIISLFLLPPLTGYAGKDVKFNIPPMSYSGPADNVGIGEPISQGWSANIYDEFICDKRAENKNVIATAKIVALSPPSSMIAHINGVDYPIFETGTEGLGWVMGVKDTHASNFTPLNINENQWYPAPGTGTLLTQTIGGSLNIYLVKTNSHLVSGKTQISSKNIATIYCYSKEGKFVDSGNVAINNIDIIVKAMGCKVLGNTDTSVSLGEFRTGQFPSVSSTQGNGVSNTTISCDKGVHVAVTVSDQSNKTNTSNIIGLTPDSKAKGVGIQALYNGKVVTLGPDSASKNNLNQFALINTTESNQIIPLQLGFQYIRTGDMKAGSANGLVGITFSYQ
ncbi:fimbrial protein [Morganella psychrotolerans]|uniref:fimbrial protein n=1 Tax=Morganella psychrotolerans TaxID=368603 RepID=UPI0039AEC87D